VFFAIIFGVSVLFSAAWAFGLIAKLADFGALLFTSWAWLS
jgi:hypothetical protein